MDGVQNLKYLIPEGLKGKELTTLDLCNIEPGDMGGNVWACLVEKFNTLVSAVGLNLPDKRVDPESWPRSGFESPLKPISGSYQLQTLHC